MTEINKKKVWKIVGKQRNVNSISGVLKPKIKDGELIEDQQVIRVYVKEKLVHPYEIEVLKKTGNLIPKKIDGIETDVVEIGEIKALIPEKKSSIKSKRLKAKKTKDNKVYALNEQRKKFRPSPAGVSAIAEGCSACTLGYFARDNVDGKIVIIANNHCTCDENRLEPGHNYLQPSPYDGGLSGDVLGQLKRFVPITGEEDNSWLLELLRRILEWLLDLFFGEKKELDTTNKVDLGIITVNPEDVKLEILNIGKVKGKRRGVIGELAEKMGRTTGYTRDGKLIDNDWYGNVGYSQGSKFFGPCGLIEKTGFSAGGDSSSAIICQDDKNYWGKLFAGSDTHTIYCHWDFIEELGNVTILIP